MIVSLQRKLADKQIKQPLLALGSASPQITDRNALKNKVTSVENAIGSIKKAEEGKGREGRKTIKEEECFKQNPSSSKEESSLDCTVSREEKGSSLYKLDCLVAVSCSRQLCPRKLGFFNDFVPYNC